MNNLPHTAQLNTDEVSNATFRRLEWAGFIAPIVFVAIYTYLVEGPAHDLVHSTWGFVALMVASAVVVIAFARLMFFSIRRIHYSLQHVSKIAEIRNAQLRTLNEANLALSEERSVALVLQRVVDLSRELVGARYAALSVLGQDGRLSAFLTSGIDQEAREAIGSLPEGKGLLGLMLKRTESLRVEDIASHPESVGFPEGHPAMETFLGMPIRYKGEAVGSLYLTEKANKTPFDDADEDVVKMFANQAALAIHNARLYEQIQAMAVETERIRISHEMHDGLAQVLGYVNTKAQAVESYLQSGQHEIAQEQVRELGQAARKVYQDIREGILALRSQVTSDRSLQDVLKEYIQEYQLQTKVQVQVELAVDSGELGLSPLQEVQVLRIVQEALTNIRKHAGATEISVAFYPQADRLEIEVRDNGKGFNPLAIKRGEFPHLGLQTMQERAEAIGGVFEVDSTPGRGTAIRVWIPGVVYPRTGGGTQ